MTLPSWKEVPIAKQHKRKGFDCGQPELNRFFAQFARQAHDSSVAKTYCAIDQADSVTVLGYYSISPTKVDLDHVPLAARPAAGGKFAVGGFLLGRLAVAKNWQGYGLGGQLFMRAIERCARASREVGGTALLIDAKDEAGAAWYQLFGAMRLVDRPFALILTYAEFNRARIAAGLPEI